MSHAANYCCAQLPEGKELGEVLRGRLAVLRVSAKNPAALQQAGSSAQLPYAFVQCDETQLHVLVFQSELARAETELKRVASGNKALACKLQRLGDWGDMDPVACVSWALTSRFPGLHCGAEYRDSDSAQTHTFLFEKEQLVREPSLLAELPEGSGGAFWSEGATLRISCERNLRVAFEAIRTRVSPVNLNKLMPTEKERAMFEGGQVVSLHDIDQDAEQYLYSRCACLNGLQKGQIVALCKSEETLRRYLQDKAYEEGEEGEVPVFRAAHDHIGKQLLRDGGDGRCSFMYVIRLESGLVILPSYAAVFSSSKPVKSPLAVSRTYQALLDLVQDLGLKMDENLFSRKAAPTSFQVPGSFSCHCCSCVLGCGSGDGGGEVGGAHSGSIEPPASESMHQDAVGVLQGEAAKGDVRTGRTSRQQSELALENEAQEFVDSVERRRKLKMKMRPGNLLARKRKLQQVRWQQFLASSQKVRFSETPRFHPPLAGEKEVPKGGNGGSAHGASAAAGPDNRVGAGAGAGSKTGSAENKTTPQGLMSAKKFSALLSIENEEQFEACEPPVVPASSAKTPRKILLTRPAAEPSRKMTFAPGSLGFATDKTKPTSSLSTAAHASVAKPATQKRRLPAASSAASSGVVLSANMPLKPVCESCEEKELVKIETEQGNYWACPQFKKFERGQGCAAFFTDAWYAERKAELLEAKEATRRAEEAAASEVGPGLSEASPATAPAAKKPAARKATAAAAKAVAPAPQAPAAAQETGTFSAASATAPALIATTQLTEEQKARIERNRQQALAIRASKAHGPAASGGRESAEHAGGASCSIGVGSSGAGEEIDEMLLCAEAQNTMAKTAKGTVAAGDAVSGEDRDETMRKTGKESGEAAEAQDGSEAVQKKAKKAPPPVTGYKLYSKAVIAEVKQEHPEAGTQDVIKIIKKMYGELDEGKKQEYESKAAELRAKQAARRGETAAQGDAENDDKGAEKAEEAAASACVPSLSEDAPAKAPLNGAVDDLIASKVAGGKRKREEDPEAAAKAAAKKEELANALASIDWRAELAANALKKRTVPQLKAYCSANGLKPKPKKDDLLEQVTKHLQDGA